MGNPFLPSTSGLQPNAGLLGTPGAIIATSITTQNIGAGALTFAIQAQCAFAAGMFVSITDTNDVSNWMWGTVTTYDGTSQLIVQVTQTNGSGQFSAWQIAISGPPGPAGATGSTGSSGGTGTSAGPVVGAAYGLKILNNSGTPNTKIDATAISASMVNSSGVSVAAASVSVTIDLTTGTSTAAANGMDGHSRGTSAWIYLYLISNGTVTAGLGSTTSPLSGTPTMPSGYSYAFFMGAMRVDGSGNLLRTRQLGRHAQYVIVAATNTAAMPQMAVSAGAVGDPTVPTWISVAVGAFVPATAGVLRGAFSCSGAVNAEVAPNNAYGVYNSTTNPPPLAVDGNFSPSAQIFEFTLESTNIYWATSATASYVWARGWEDYCVAA